MIAMALMCGLFPALPQGGAEDLNDIRLVSVNVRVLEYSDGQAEKEMDSKALAKLVASAKPVATSEFNVKTISKRQASIQVGEEVPVVTGMARGRNGQVVPTYKRQQVGSILEVTAAVAKESLVIQLVVEVSRLAQTQRKVAADNNDITPPSKTLLMLNTTVAVKPREPLYLSVRDQNPKTNHHFILVISADSEALVK